MPFSDVEHAPSSQPAAQSQNLQAAAQVRCSMPKPQAQSFSLPFSPPRSTWTWRQSGSKSASQPVVEVLEPAPGQELSEQALLQAPSSHHGPQAHPWN